MLFPIARKINAYLMNVMKKRKIKPFVSAHNVLKDFRPRNALSRNGKMVNFQDITPVQTDCF